MDSELPSASFFDRFTHELAFSRKWEMNYEGQKIDFVFRRFFKIVIWRPMLKLCSLEDNRITYPKSIGSLGLCYTDAEISTREVTP